METLFQDIRYGLRTFRTQRAFTAVSLIILALGIGASTAIFSIVNGVLLKPLPYAEPERLVRVYGTWEHGNREGTSLLDFADYRDQNTVFQSVAAAGISSPLLNFTGDGEPEQVASKSCTSGFFRTLGVKTLYGREFLPEEEARNGPRVVLLTYGLWMRRFGGDPNIVGRSTNINFAPVTIVGVLPLMFNFLGSAEAWMPLQFSTSAMQSGNPEVRQSRTLVMVGRFKSGVDVAAAQSEMTVLARRLETVHPKYNKGWSITILPLAGEVVQGVRPALLMLLGAVGFVLLIVCANVASLMLSLAMRRQTEMAVRSSLGASPLRVLRQLITESLVLSLVGGALGCLLASYGIQLFKRFGPSNIPRIQDIGVDLRMLAFALVVSLAVGLLCCAEPGLRAMRLDLGSALRAGGRSIGGQRSLRSALVVVEVALSVVLLVGAGLLIRSLLRLQLVNPGFRTSDVMTTRLSTSPRKYASQVLMGGFFSNVIEKIEQSPGVTAAAAISEVPLGGLNNPTPRVATTPEGKDFFTHLRSVTPRYFETMGIPLLEGRMISRDDRIGTPRVMLINETFRRDVFGSGNPLGQKMALNFEGYAAIIVGVVADVRHTSLTAIPFREAYLPLEQNPLPSYNLVVRTSIDRIAMANALRGAVRAVDADHSVGPLLTMNSLVDRGLEQPRFRVLILSMFAAIAVILSAVGLYGVLSYLVSQRAKEIGLRLALGANRGDILKLVVGRGMVLTGIGLAAGIAVAFGVSRLISSLLFGVSLNDRLSFLLGPAVLIVAALAATYLPGRRAMLMDPVVALREE